MSEEESTPAVEQEEANGGSESTIQDPTIIAKLRDEIKQWKSKARDSEAKWKEAEPVLAEYQAAQDAQKTNEQKLSERLAAMEAELVQARQQAETTAKRGNLLKLATKAGVSPDLVDLLDISKIPLDDEAAALKTLQQFAATRPGGGSGSNPGRDGGGGGTDEAALRQHYFGGGRNRPTIFGG